VLIYSCPIRRAPGPEARSASYGNNHGRWKNDSTYHQTIMLRVLYLTPLAFGAEGSFCSLKIAADFGAERAREPKP
jgi:hypothetical protein